MPLQICWIDRRTEGGEEGSTRQGATFLSSGMDMVYTILHREVLNYDDDSSVDPWGKVVYEAIRLIIFATYFAKYRGWFMKREEEGKFHIRWIELSKIPGKKSNRIKMESKEGKKKKKKIDRRSSIIGMKTSSSMLRFIDLLRLVRKKTSNYREINRIIRVDSPLFSFDSFLWKRGGEKEREREREREEKSSNLIKTIVSVTNVKFYDALYLNGFTNDL